MPFIQAAILVSGLFFSLRTSLKVGLRRDPSGATTVQTTTPIAAFLLAATLILLWMYLG